MAATALVLAPWVLAGATPDAVVEARATTKQLSGEAFRKWHVDNDKRFCPKSLVPLLKFSNVRKDLLDPWGEPYVMMCGSDPSDDVFGVVSKGKDRTLGTSDDIASWSLWGRGCLKRDYLR